MYQFNVSDMTCGHCASAITKAVKAADRAARVAVSLQSKTVSVESALAQQEIAEAISEAGYTPRVA